MLLAEARRNSIVHIIEDEPATVINPFTGEPVGVPTTLNRPTPGTEATHLKNY